MTTISSFRGEYEFLSNFSYSPFIYKSVWYPTNEHFYQAMKTLDPNTRISIANCTTPGQAKRAGRHVELREDWESIKDDVMLYGLRKKFNDPILKNKLLATGDAILIEGNAWNDTYWGVCNGVGQNKLGQLLMQVRNELKDA